MATPLKAADRSATFSFCPNAGYIATGSVAGAIDLSFSTSSLLEVRRYLLFDLRLTKRFVTVALSICCRLSRLLGSLKMILI